MTSSMTVREAHQGDLNQIVSLLQDDDLGQTREDASKISAYEKAFHAILLDPNHCVLVIEGDKGLLGCAQLSYLPNLTFSGAWRAQLEGVRINSNHRGRGLGRLLFVEAITLATAHGCKILQLTTNNSRSKSIKFYESLGFQGSHVGMKLHLNEFE